ncbi:hypothetical protein GQ651_12735 [Alphaproteobacteria bacterium GH1-50]|uniref:Cell division and transport-associated protein TolA n=1 Tax=Kangsaoukella pontilimi TaxID=2691042 RepID=A0A7C9MKS7_9RHOB|nr:hypothetical protein [Kangsaoukella pontilimi]
MRQGWIISVAMHVLLVLIVLFGGFFARDRIPEVTVADVALISEAEYAALLPSGPTPEVELDAPEIAAPVEDAAPETPEADRPPERPEPEAVDVPETPPAEPEVTVPAPAPEAVVEDDAPEVPLPPTDIDGSSPLPDQVAEPAPRVAPIPQVAPPPLTEVAPDVVEDTAPDAEAPPVEQPVEETPPAAPEAASDRIVTEAEETREFAPASSMRPRSRPERPVRVAAPEPQPTPAPTPEPTPAPETSSTDDAVRAALEGGQAEEPARPSGPPLTGGEREAFRVAVGGCWVVDPGARSAGVVVTVAFELDQTGRVSGDVRQVSATGGDAATQRAAFDAARRAILRCGARGFPLPADKYDQWREVEMTFNPEGMQFR